MNEEINLLSSAELNAVYLGKIVEDGYYKNEALQELDESLKDILTIFFLKPIKPGVVYTFNHEIDLKYNAAYAACSVIFEQPDQFLEQSQQLLKLLYAASENQNIIEGEFYTAYFDKVYHDGAYVKALGIFKSESKDPFLTIGKDAADLKMEPHEGISIHNIHKGALIYCTEEPDSYQVTVFDKNNSQQPARFWVSDFLNVRPYEDQFFHTQHVINLCKDFAKKGQSEMDGADRADLLNRTMDFFQTNETFELPAFEAEVLKEENVMQSFYEHREKYVADMDMEDMQESFEISLPAIQKSKKHVRSVIKLDKNFHLYVHGRRDLVERGYDDERGMHFYKVFFQEEH
jgi:hypothetical protein